MAGNGSFTTLAALAHSNASSELTTDRNGDRNGNAATHPNNNGASAVTGTAAPTAAYVGVPVVPVIPGLNGFSAHSIHGIHDNGIHGGGVGRGNGVGGVGRGIAPLAASVAVPHQGNYSFGGQYAAPNANAFGLPMGLGRTKPTERSLLIANRHHPHLEAHSGSPSRGFGNGVGALGLRVGGSGLGSGPLSSGPMLPRTPNSMIDSHSIPPLLDISQSENAEKTHVEQHSVETPADDLITSGALQGMLGLSSAYNPTDSLMGTDEAINELAAVDRESAVRKSDHKDHKDHKHVSKEPTKGEPTKQDNKQDKDPKPVLKPMAIADGLSRMRVIAMAQHKPQTKPIEFALKKANKGDQGDQQSPLSQESDSTDTESVSSDSDTSSTSPIRGDDGDSETESDPEMTESDADSDWDTKKGGKKGKANKDKDKDKADKKKPSKSSKPFKSSSSQQKDRPKESKRTKGKKGKPTIKPTKQINTKSISVGMAIEMFAVAMSNTNTNTNTKASSGDSNEPTESTIEFYPWLKFTIQNVGDRKDGNQNKKVLVSFYDDLTYRDQQCAERFTQIALRCLADVMVEMCSLTKGKRGTRSFQQQLEYCQTFAARFKSTVNDDDDEELSDLLSGLAASDGEAVSVSDWLDSFEDVLSSAKADDFWLSTHTVNVEVPPSLIHEKPGKVVQKTQKTQRTVGKTAGQKRKRDETKPTQKAKSTKPKEMMETQSTNQSATLLVPTRLVPTQLVTHATTTATATATATAKSIREGSSEQHLTHTKRQKMATSHTAVPTTVQNYDSGDDVNVVSVVNDGGGEVGNGGNGGNGGGSGSDTALNFHNQATELAKMNRTLMEFMNQLKETQKKQQLQLAELAIAQKAQLTASQQQPQMDAQTDTNKFLASLFQVQIEQSKTQMEQSKAQMEHIKAQTEQTKAQTEQTKVLMNALAQRVQPVAKFRKGKPFVRGVSAVVGSSGAASDANRGARNAALKPTSSVGGRHLIRGGGVQSTNNGHARDPSPSDP